MKSTVLLYHKESENPEQSLYSTEKGSRACPKRHTQSVEMAPSASKAMLSTSVFYSNMTDSSQQLWLNHGADSPGGKVDQTPGEVWMLPRVFKSLQARF